MSVLSSLVLAALTTFSLSAMEPDLASTNADHISVGIDNVGQGNFIRIEIPYKTESKRAHIVVDCGSGSSHREFKHMAKLENKEDSLTLEKLFKRERRNILGNKKDRKHVHIMGLILTHPDLDHINQIPSLFNHPGDKIDYIICGGLPEMYQKHDLNFGEWIDQLITNNSRVYFPAISYEPIRSFRGVLPLPNRLESYQPYPAWAGRKFTSEDYKRHPFPEFIEALTAINDDFQLYFLTVNPTHITGKGGTVRLTNAAKWVEKEKETNTDSLVLKISYGKSSMILPGDATGITTSRIQSTYSPPFLEAPILLLAHHGSITEGSNNDVWLNLVKPKYILISTGRTYGHPLKKAIKRFRSLESLEKNVTSHRISWSKKRSKHRKI